MPLGKNRLEKLRNWDMMIHLLIAVLLGEKCFFPSGVEGFVSYVYKNRTKSHFSETF